MRTAPLCLMILAATAPARATEWVVDPSTSALTVVVQQGGRPFTARFERWTGSISFDAAALSSARAVLDIDVASFTSGDRQRDPMAIGRDFLDAAEHPTARYAATSFTAMGEGTYAVKGTLSLRGVTKDVAHQAVISVHDDVATATGEVPLMRTDWGVGQGQFATGAAVGLEVTVRFDLKARKAG